MDLKQFWQNSAQELYKKYFPFAQVVITSGMNDGLDAVEAIIGSELDRLFVNEAAKAFAERYTFQMVSGITETSRNLTRKYVSEWIESGEELDTLFETLSWIFGETRADMIGVTEVTRMYARANLEAWRATTVVQGVIIRTSVDELVCPICGPKEGMFVPLDASEDQFPPFHTRCRCGIIPKVKI